MSTDVHRDISAIERIAFGASIIASLAVTAAIYVGSRQLKHFDWALTAYAMGTISAVFLTAYRSIVWSQRPPTWMYLKRGFQMFARRRGNIRRLARRLSDNFVLQKFIRRRSSERWLMHLCLSWGGMLAFAMTFPLVFGWIHFETLRTNAEIYRVFVFDFPVEEFSIHSLRALLHFNLLNISAVLMLLGLALSFKMRVRDKGEIAIQTFAEDILPLLLLFSVASTGLMLTISSSFLGGSGFRWIGYGHAASVIGLLLYLPFGKLFHIVQRPLALGVSFYKDEGERGLAASCRRCGSKYASQLHIDDLKTILDQIGFNFRFAAAGSELHYQDICPPCRRRLFTLNQGRAVGR